MGVSADVRERLAAHLATRVAADVHAYSPSKINEPTLIVEVASTSWGLHRTAVTVEVAVLIPHRGDNAVVDKRWTLLSDATFDAVQSFDGWAPEPFGTAIDFTDPEESGEGTDLSLSVIRATILVDNDPVLSALTGFPADVADVVAATPGLTYATASDSPPFAVVRSGGAQGGDGRYSAAAVWVAAAPDNDIEALGTLVWTTLQATPAMLPQPREAALRSSPPGSVLVHDVTRILVLQS